MNKPFTINQRVIGAGAPCFIIAEAGVNHNGDMAMARSLVEAAADAGADAVKFQTFKAAKLTSAHAPKANYQLATTSAAETQQAMLQKLELPHAAHLELIELCRQRGIMFMSSPFEEESASFLVKIGVSALKIPSGEITNFPFLQHIARLGLPLIMSSGMATLAEVDEGLRVLRESGCTNVALLHCVSNYPAAPADCNLRAMATMEAAFQVPVGFSDHTLGVEVSLAAVALGATIIEKHITLDKSLPGPDQPASLEPQELIAFVRGIRAVESSLGDGRKEPALSERNTAMVARKSIVAAADIAAGTTIDRSMVFMSRPGTGLPSKLLPLVVGRTAKTAIAAGATLEMAQLA
jgi:N-acetylneuraminate synthase